MLVSQQGWKCFQANGFVASPFVAVARRFLSSTTPKTPEQKEADERKAAKRKETHISLIQPDKTIIHTTLEDATKLSNRRDLKLIKIADYDRKRDAPLYQLMTAAQYREEALSLKKSKKQPAGKSPFKGEKLLPLNSKIGDNDLKSKVQKILSWLEKNHEIRVTITGSKEDDSASENVFKKIENIVGTQGRILQKRNSGGDIKFQIIPPKQTSAPEKGDNVIKTGSN